MKIITKITLVGVDIAKAVFQIHAADKDGRTVWTRKRPRATWIEALCQKIEPGCEIGMVVKLMAPQFVKPYVKSNKNHANDAEAICEAMSQPNRRFVPVKTVEQQDLQAQHRVRSEVVCARTAKANQIRGLVENTDWSRRSRWLNFTKRYPCGGKTRPTV